MALMKIYTNNPTEGGTDGTAVSENGALTAPITANVIASETEAVSEVVTCAMRCDEGYQTNGAFQLKTVNTSDKTDYTGENVKISLDNSNFYNSLMVTAPVGEKNVLFYVKLTAAIGENPVNDTSVQIYHNATIGATT